MPGAEVRRYSSDRRGLALNLFLGVAAGAVATLAESLLLPIIVLAFFVGQLTDSYAAVGLVPAIGVGLWTLARLPAAFFVASQRRKQPWAIAASLIKAAAMALLAIVCLRVDPTTLDAAADPLLRSFFLCWVAYSLAAGFASVPTAALVAKAIPDEGRALFYRQRGLWGGVAGLIAGFVVAQLLRTGDPGFPRNFGLLFLASTVCQLATVFFLSTLREPVRVADATVASPLAVVRAVPEAMADPSYRRFLLFRLLLSLSALIDPFLVIYALSRLSVPVAAIGGYVVAFVLGRVVSAPVWAAIGRRLGDKALLQSTALLRMIPPALALVLQYLNGFAPLRQAATGGNLLATLLGVAFFALGAATAGQARGNFAYLADVTVPRQRPLYAGLTNALLAVAAVAPIAGGLIVARSGYDTLFLTGAAIALLAVFASGALTDTFVRARGATTRVRLRRTGGPPTARVVAVAAPAHGSTDRP